MPNEPDKLRIWLTFCIATVGIVAVSLILIITAVIFHSDSDAGKTIAAIVGAGFGVIGTLAGYVAGQAAGSAGKERAEDRATSAHNAALVAHEKAAREKTKLGTVALAAEDMLQPATGPQTQSAPAPLPAGGELRFIAELARKLYEETD